MAIHKTEAIVLRTTKLRETSLIITFFSWEFGKFQAVAKGVRQPGSPWAGLYEPMNRLEVVFYEKFRTDIHLATEAYELDLRRDLRKNFEAVATGYYLTELLEAFSNVGEPDEDYWVLIEKAYHSLTVSPSLVSLIFQLKILHHSGFFPDLNSAKPETGDQGLLDTFTSYLDQVMKKTDSKFLLGKKPPIKHVQMLRTFQYLLKEDWEKAFRLQMTHEEIDEAEHFLSWLVTAKLDKRLKSRRFLEELTQFQSI